MIEHGHKYGMLTIWKQLSRQIKQPKRLLPSLMGLISARPESSGRQQGQGKKSIIHYKKKKPS